LLGSICVAKYLSLFTRKHRQTYPHLCSHLRRHVCRPLYLNPDFNLGLELYPSLFGWLFPNSFRSSFPALFRFVFLASFRAM